MDTREKIVDLENLPELLSRDAWAVVPGYFDPLTAEQAQRVRSFAESGHKVLIIVQSQADSLLTAEARAELGAALRTVSAVTISRHDEWRSLIPGSARVVLFEDEAGERKRSEKFVEFVLQRQRANDLDRCSSHRDRSLPEYRRVVGLTR